MGMAMTPASGLARNPNGQNAESEAGLSRLVSADWASNVDQPAEWAMAGGT